MTKLSKKEAKYSPEAIATNVKDVTQRLGFVVFIEIALITIIQIYTIRYRFRVIKGILAVDPYFLFEEMFRSGIYLFFMNVIDLILMVSVFVFLYQYATRIRRLSAFIEKTKTSVDTAGVVLSIGILFGVVGYIIDLFARFVTLGFLFYIGYSVKIVTSAVFAVAFYKLAQFQRECYMRGLLDKKETQMIFFSQLISIFSSVLYIVSYTQFTTLNTNYLFIAIGGLVLMFLSGIALTFGLYQFYFEVQNINTLYESAGETTPVGESHRAPASIELQAPQEQAIQHKASRIRKRKKKESETQITDIKETRTTTFCPNCGKENSINAKFCMYCVSKLKTKK
ncbi:MAG: zinc ribbon domain-containing protein [Candidatus Heimdallarchaeaceae archaeon]